MSDEIKISGEGTASSGEGAGGGAEKRPRTVHFNPSDPSSPGPQSRSSEGLRIDPSELKPPPSEDHRLPSPTGNYPSNISSDEAETYLGSPSVASSASEFTDKDLDTQNLGVMLQDRYRLQRVLGKGGFGVVYLAHDRVLDQDVAIKVLKLGAATEGYKKRFIFEARTAAKLRHMAIVNVFDIVQTEGGLQLVMEYYPGGTMGDLIKRDGRVRPKEALGFIRQIALGLGFAHKKGIIHRDIKPANIFFADDETVKLGDFGICASYENHDHTMTGEVIGTPLYMAPEQQKDSKDVDPRADIYALGMTLYHMLVGRPPRVVNLDEVPPRIRPMIQQCTAYDRKERPASCQQLVAMIDQLLKNWDQIDNAMRGADTEMAGGGGAGSSGFISGGPSAGGADSGGPRAVSTRTSDPISATNAEGWDPNEATQTQARTSGMETGGTTVVQTHGSNWSMVALVGLVIAGFLAVIFMLVRNEIPRPGLVAASPSSSSGVVSEAPPTLTNEIPENGATPEVIEAAPTEDPETVESGGDPEVEIEEAAPDTGTEEEVAMPVVESEPWIPVQPEWANEEPASGGQGIENFLADQAGGEALSFTRDTFLVLGDWADNRSNPSAPIFRESAVKRLEQAVERYPGEAIFPYLLGRLYEESGNPENAVSQFQRVREMDSAFIAQFDRVILDFLGEMDLEKKASQPLKSFLMTPSPLAKEPS